ncbi:MAG: type II toxin-antitoxin system PemK/MazF family toxin [Deltaproteobacteria bacterium]|nr:type II toxin-antitoxin system PemK/MazF family toxin [Deltaproteobacteria bacterium]
MGPRAGGPSRQGVGPRSSSQADAGNQATTYANTIVVAISSQGHEIPLHVRLRPSRQNGLRNVSFVKCKQIFTISKERLGARLGALKPEEMLAVDQALRTSLALTVPTRND